MDVHTAKLDLINWLVNLKDEAIISALQSIKNGKEDSIDTLINENNDLQQLLDKRLEEKTVDFVDARSSLNKLRHQYGI
ncbi:hypothetical protein LY01_03008 [Nonlabens xylanidelens]|uniref:Addiction module component n=1 Tax=Nonlabens xylanidelens TaxID=191564 RepID=A0A2S6IDJ1_9FLAO|nr:hypothetical protein [Nonlabens xylanidelens]PPK92243.1 hypothetical protein LY01_03016 [Nonlabens xylanidelens]PPK92250.1 hypothetical protein LY01_03008 [Nonlabens xylanidelens]PQJ18919.1 hypothetical protein BST94_06790 [Nonlabens xylanidelens]PQJ19515.1 hypothetical protein BST94_06735 [Nonlabens xylanidelens]PQJ19527.1 hypothetical protein BST94_06650 [Nonlabens xylanidelens]